MRFWRTKKFPEVARLYTNENFPIAVVTELRVLGHDVVTTHEAGRSNFGIEDEAVLDFATESGRCVVTLNRKDFIRLHRGNPSHAGIIVCTENRDYRAMAVRIDEAIRDERDLAGRLLRIVRGNPG